MIEILHNPDVDQNYHVRITSSGNNHTLVFGENLHSEDAALAEIVAVAKEFGIKDAVMTDIGGEYWLNTHDMQMLAKVTVVHTRNQEPTE